MAYQNILFEGSTVQNLTQDQNVLQMAYLKVWRKRKAEMDLLLHSDTDDDHESQRSVTNRSACGLHNNQADTTSNLESINSATDSLTTDESDFDTDVEYVSSDSEKEVLNDDAELDFPDLEDNLRQWSTKNKITQRSLNELLAILRKQGHLLPKDARTLLVTPRAIGSEPKCSGQYIYYGLEKGICRLLSQTKSFTHDHDSVNLSINIDGVPLFKSSKVQFWPILAKFHNFEPFMVALFCGENKPYPLEEYLDDFLMECKDLTENGLIHEEKTYTVNVKALICDAPTRAYLKRIKNHNAYHSCERCITKGAYITKRVAFNEQGCTLRTDEAFSAVAYKNHQTGVSPFIAAGLSCVSSFVLDYMHMVNLGVVRRMLIFLTRGPTLCRLSVRQRQEISQKLNRLRGKMPSEFARQPRGLEDLDRWKATEFRQFLLYTGPVVLKNVLSPERYYHFLSLAVAMSIMLESDESTRNAYLQYAHELMSHFEMRCADLYGNYFSVYNVHGLIHLHEDVRHFNCSLNDISGFPFENHLQQIKKQERSGKNPLAQVTRRLSEIEYANAKTQPEARPRMFLSTKERDNCFLLRDEKFAFIRERRGDGIVLCDVLHQRYTSPLFEKPCNSKLLNIVYTRNGQGRMKRRQLLETDLFRKLACLPHENGSVLLPLLHGIEHRI